MNRSSHSTEKLICNGRVCTRCGHCRDWYWHPKANGDKHYTKRRDASCTFVSYRGPASTRMSYSLYYFHYPVRGDESIYNHSIGELILCECESNRS
jgi:hypothetical protein